MITIPIKNMDPRLVLQVSLWVERVSDPDGPTQTNAQVASGVSWSMYGARKGAEGNSRILQAVDGFDAREVRGADAWRPDGILAAGDGGEFSCLGDLLMVIKANNIYATLPGELQSIWVAFDLYASDAALEDATKEDAEMFKGTMDRVKVAMPTDVATVIAGGGG